MSRSSRSSTRRLRSPALALTVLAAAACGGGDPAGEAPDRAQAPVDGGTAVVSRVSDFDAFNQFDVVHATIEVQGTPIRRLPMPDDIRQISGNSFATHVDLSVIVAARR